MKKLTVGLMFAVFCLGMTGVVSAEPFAYITNFSSHDVSVIDISSDTVITTISTLPNPYGVAVSPDGTRVYVTNSGSSYHLTIIDTLTNAVIATIPVGIYPFGVTVSPDGTKVYAVNAFDDNVYVIDTLTNTVDTTIPVGRWPIAFGQFITPSLTPKQQIKNIIAKIETLVTGGILNQGEGMALTATLNIAIQKLEDSNTKTACNMLNSFINKIEAKVTAEILTAEEGLTLIDMARTVCY